MCNNCHFLRITAAFSFSVSILINHKIYPAPINYQSVVLGCNFDFESNTNKKTNTMKTPTSYSRSNKIGITSLLKKSGLVLFLSIISFLSQAQTHAKNIIGNYMVPSKDGAISIYESKGKYYGKITLNKDASKLDINNPAPLDL